jgi:hypothetical protein
MMMGQGFEEAYNRACHNAICTPFVGCKRDALQIKKLGMACVMTSQEKKNHRQRCYAIHRQQGGKYLPRE